MNNKATGSVSGHKGTPNNEEHPFALKEVTVVGQKIEPKFLVSDDRKGGAQNASSVKLKDILQNAGTAKEFVSDVISARSALKESVGEAEAAVSAGKSTIKDVVKTTGEMIDAVGSTYDVATKGPAYASPLTGMVFDQWKSTTMDGMAGGYGNILDNQGFNDARNKGYYALAEFVNNTGNVGNIGFAYSNVNVIGSDGVTLGSGPNAVNLINGNLATTHPLSQTQLQDAEMSSKLDIKFAYWGRFVGGNLQLLGSYKLK